MKSKSSVLALFFLFWTAMFGLSFFDNSSKLKSFLGYSGKLGYRMYAPPTTTNYEVNLHFYRDGDFLHSLKLSEYLLNETHQSILKDKESFVKRKIFLESMKRFDFEYQMMVYEDRKNKTQTDFDELIEQKPVLSRTVEALGNLGRLCNREMNGLADSVWVEVERHPIVVEFAPERQNDFTYVVGERVFYKTGLKL